MITILILAVSFELGGFWQNFAIFKSDTDFDPTPASYEPWGQTASVIATYGEPMFRLTLDDKTAVFWEVLFGFNVWGKNTVIQRPEEAGILGRQIFFVLRQFYADLKVGGGNLKVGYQYFADESEVFVRHWIAGVSFEFKPVKFFVAQIPDQTFEGIALTENNLLNDIFLSGVQFSPKPFFTGVFGLFDFSVIGRPRITGTGQVGVRNEDERFGYLFSLYGQFGRWFESADGDDETRLAGAVILDGFLKPKPVGVGATFSLLTGGTQTGASRTNSFIWSGKLPNRTLLLTEDEIIFRGDNLDLLVSERVSGFFIARAGLATADIRLMLSFGKTLFTIVGGILTTLDDRSFQDNFVAGEVSGILSAQVSERSQLDIALTLIKPGRKGGFFANSINPYLLRPFIVAGEISLKVSF